MASFRFASFNVENLFSRAKVLNLDDSAEINAKLRAVAEFTKLARKSSAFTAANKARLVQLMRELSSFVILQENRAKLFNRNKTKVVASSGKNWDGEIALRRAKFSDLSRRNTAKIIRTVKADVVCIVEAEDRQTLRSFDSDLLSSRYPVDMLLDGNDPRGIDVGLYSKFPLGGSWTHMFDKKNNKIIFSRDCPEYELLLPGGRSLYVLCNHLKSKGSLGGAANPFGPASSST